jgi:hypothetical protein
MIHARVNRQRIGLVCVAALVVLAGCAGMGGGGDAASAPQAGGNGGDGAELSASYDSGGNGVGSYYTDDGDRVIVRESDMSLQVDNFSRAFHRLRAIAADNDGYVGDRSQDSQGEWDRGTVTLRVPPERFASARDAVASLGHVEREDVHVKDFTSEYDDREERLRQLEGEERELERLLNETDDVDEADRVRADLHEVRTDIRNLHSQQQSLQQRESMSTIRVDMHEPESEKPPKNYESAFGFTDAFLEAFYGGLTALKYVIVFFGYVIPVGLALIPLGVFGVGVVAGWRRTIGFARRLFARSGGGRSGVSAENAAIGERGATDAESGEDGDRSDSE